MYFVIVTLLFQLLAKHSSAASMHVSDLLTSACTCIAKQFIHTNPLYTPISLTSPIMNLFSLLNTRAKTNQARFTIYERTHYCILKFLHDLELFCNSKYQNPMNKTKPLALLKKHKL